MPKIDLDAIPAETGSNYPAPFDAAVLPRTYRSLSRSAGITDFEANLVTLEPGTWSSQRHWHEGEDEFLAILSGTATLVDDNGETPLAAGDCAAFPKNDGNGHHLIAGASGCSFVVVGIAEATPCHYPDIDLLLDPVAGRYAHRDGTPY